MSFCFKKHYLHAKMRQYRKLGFKRISEEDARALTLAIESIPVELGTYSTSPIIKNDLFKKFRSWYKGGHVVEEFELEQFQKYEC